MHGHLNPETKGSMHSDFEKRTPICKRKQKGHKKEHPFAQKINTVRISYPLFSLFLHLSSIFSRTKHTCIQNMISLEQILLIANGHIYSDETNFNLISTDSFQHFAYENTRETISNLGHHTHLSIHKT